MIIIMIIILTMINDDDDLNTLVDFAVSGRAGVGARVLRCHSSVDDLIIVMMMMIMVMMMIIIIIIMIKTWSANRTMGPSGKHCDYALRFDYDKRWWSWQWWWWWWFASSSLMHFGFNNRHPFFCTPCSLDWPPLVLYL